MAQDGNSGLRRNEISTDDPEEIFEMLDIIGEGSYGLICTCRNVKTQQIMAIKFLDIEEEEEPGLQKEIDILRESSECRNIVKYFNCYIKETTLLIVMEFCDGGSALDLMQLCNKSFSEEEISAILQHMIKGLIYLHSHKILHRDIKAGNVLLSSEGVAKLADFGVSAKLTHTLQKKKTIVGSPYWMAPEVITVTKENQEGYDLKADIWSLGITSIELADKKPPLFDIASLRVIFLIPSREPPSFKEPAKWSKEFNDFVTTCLKKDPTKRLTSNEILKHSFVQKAKDTESIIKKIVVENIEELNKARQAKKTKKEKKADEDTSGSIGPGTFIKVNSTTGKFDTNKAISYGTTIISPEEEENDSGSFGTTKINTLDEDEGGSYATTKMN